MKMSAKMDGLEGAMKALEAAFPYDYKIQSQMINGAMGGAARKSILPIAKQMAKTGDGSGSLSEAMGVRAQKARRRKGKAGGMQVLPVRFNKKAIAMYIQHYYTSRGKNPPANILSSGIRHGHLVEFGTVAGKKHAATAAKPFLWPAAAAGKTKYISLFAKELKKRIESRVKREAKKRAKQ